MYFAFLPSNAGTLSWRDFKISVYVSGSACYDFKISVLTCPNLTKLGPNRTSPSRIKVAASIWDTLISAGSVNLRAANTLNTHLTANIHTLALRRKLDREPRSSHPCSISPSTVLSEDMASIALDMPLVFSLSTSSQYSPLTKPTVLPMSRLRLDYAKMFFSKSQVRMVDYRCCDGLCVVRASSSAIKKLQKDRHK
jgi:hypothetical protein